MSVRFTGFSVGTAAPRGSTRLVQREQGQGKWGSVSRDQTTKTAYYHSTAAEGTAEAPSLMRHSLVDQNPFQTSDLRSWCLPASLSLAVPNPGQHGATIINTR